MLNTCLGRYGVENPSQNKEIQEKKKQTNLKNWGVENVFQSEKIKEKIKQTCLDRYGVENVFQSVEIIEKIRKTNIENGHWSDNINEFEKYRNKVDGLTRKVKRELLESWDGYDFYDKEYIRDSFDLNCNSPNYPTIDHKDSVLYGYLNGISPEEISKIDNLCITKLGINSSKGHECHEEFIKNLNN